MQSSLSVFFFVVVVLNVFTVELLKACTEDMCVDYESLGENTGYKQYLLGFHDHMLLEDF